MVALAEGLPVRLVPEQFLVAVVGRDVIDDGRGPRDVTALALHTEWMLGEEALTRASPSRVVATLCRAPSAVFVGAAVRLTAITIGEG